MPQGTNTVQGPEGQGQFSQVVYCSPMATKVIDRTIRLGQFPMTRRVHYFILSYFFY